jgi:uncharacterized protein (DUF3084 family)
MRKPKFEFVRRPVTVERIMGDLRVSREDAQRIHAAGNQWAIARVPVKPEARKTRNPRALAREASADRARQTAKAICGE